MTILLTGVHLTPALATLQVLRKKDPGLRLIYIGRRHTGISRSVEKEEIERIGGEFKTIVFGKWHRHFTFRQACEVVSVPVGFFMARKLLRDCRPNVVVSFGGYTALPVGIWARIMKIPLVVHEQTHSWGAANRVLAKIAQVKAGSWDKTLGDKVFYTGNPLREEVLMAGRKKRREAAGYREGERKPVLYIAGGNQGSLVIDRIFRPILPKLIKRYHIFHQTQSNFGIKDPSYVRSAWFSTPKHAEIMQRADLFVGRSGANTVFELAYCAVKAILIPLPSSAGGEQLKNATALAETGLVQILTQDILSAETIIGAIKKLEKGVITRNIDLRDWVKIENNAGEKLAGLILECGEKEGV